MVVISNRVLAVTRIVRVFLYRLVAKNSLVFYSFLALWFNISPLYLKFLVFANSEFSVVGLESPRFYLLIFLSNQSIFGSILSLPNYSKKQFMFGSHSLVLSGFDLFKLAFWSLDTFCWVSFRKYFTSFSLVLLLRGKSG